VTGRQATTDRRQEDSHKTVTVMAWCPQTRKTKNSDFYPHEK
jgi:hypothetical protein